MPAFAAAAYALLTNEIWEIADNLTTLQLVAANVLSILAMVVWLIAAHELWERPPGGSRGKRPRPNNVATLITVLIGVLVMYLSVFALSVVAEVIVLQRDVVESTLKHPADWQTYAVIAWLASSIATVGGAIGSGLESSEDVQAAVGMGSGRK